MPAGKQKTSRGLFLAVRARGSEDICTSLKQNGCDFRRIKGDALSIGFDAICGEVMEQRCTMSVMRPADDEIWRPVECADQAWDVSDEQILDGAFEDWIAWLVSSGAGLAPTHETVRSGDSFQCVDI